MPPAAMSRMVSAATSLVKRWNISELLTIGFEGERDFLALLRADRHAQRPGAEFFVDRLNRVGPGRHIR